MSDVVRLSTLNEVEEEAAAWIWRLDSEAVTEADRQRFDAWIRRDPRNRRAFTELGGVWEQLEGLAEAKHPEKIATFTAPARGTRSSLGMWGAGIAATLVIAVSSWLIGTPHSTGMESVSTAVGQHRTVVLADSSVVSLNTNSIMETHLARSLRDIYLRKGEAHFVVAHDQSRPFLVHAGDRTVRALGTEFDVRILDARQIEVTVNQGRVEVQSAEATQAATRTAAAIPIPNAVPLVLRAGERLRTDSTEIAVQSVGAGIVERNLAWRQGAVIFEGQTLAEAVTELSRYTDTRFFITDPHIRDLPVGGRFRTADVEGFLAALEKALPVTVRRAPDGVVNIEARP